MEPVETAVRQRTRQACEACKLRKRRCDSNQPCNSCQRHQYECHYSPQRRRRSNKVQSTETPPALVSDSGLVRTAKPHISFVGTCQTGKIDAPSPEANSGISFPQLVGNSLSPNDNPKLQGSGWNLSHHFSSSTSTKDITSIVSRDEWLSLLAIYIQKVHPVYSFLDLATVRAKSATRWSGVSETNSYDHVLCGIAALACLFTPGPIDAREELFVNYARDLLQASSHDRYPGPHEVQASLLRLLYVRINCSPHAAWMTSGATMQIIEASGLHKEETRSMSKDNHGFDAAIDIECRRKTYWLARLLNTWISNEYGRSRYNIVGASCRVPTAIPDDPITEFLVLLKICAVLDPDKSPSIGELELAIRSVKQCTSSTDCVILSKANLCFTLYRRLRLVTGSIGHELQNSIIEIGVEGLHASSNAAQSWTPWWHVSNVPFQFTCILLAMDTPEALFNVPEAIAALRLAADTFESRGAQVALATVEQLVALSHKRKQQGISLLASVMSGQHADSTENLVCAPDTTFAADPADPWLNDLLWNFPPLDNVDRNQLGDDIFAANLQ